MKRLFVTFALILSFNAFGQNAEVLECERCSDAQMRNLAEIYTLQAPTFKDILIIDLITGNFREFEVVSSSGSGGGFPGGSSSVTMKPTRHNQNQIESDIKDISNAYSKIAYAIQSVGEYDVTMEGHDIYKSAADGLNPEYRAGVAASIEEILETFDEYQQQSMLVDSKLKKIPFLELFKREVIDMLTNKYSSNIISIPFDDESLLEVKLELIAKDGKPYIKVTCTNRAYLADGTRMPLNDLEAKQFKSLIENGSLGSAVNAISFLKYLDSVPNITTSSSFLPPASGGIGGGCLAVCTTVEWPDGRVSDAGCHTPPDCGR